MKLRSHPLGLGRRIQVGDVGCMCTCVLLACFTSNTTFTSLYLCIDDERGQFKLLGIVSPDMDSIGFASLGFAGLVLHFHWTCTSFLVLFVFVFPLAFLSYTSCWSIISSSYPLAMTTACYDLLLVSAIHAP